MIKEEIVKKLTNTHLCNWITCNVLHQCGVGSSRLLVNPNIQLHLVDFGIHNGFQLPIIVFMVTPDVADQVLVVVHGDPHLAQVVEALVEGFPGLPER